jgi:hypothetical protein
MHTILFNITPQRIYPYALPFGPHRSAFTGETPEITTRSKLQDQQSATSSRVLIGDLRPKVTSPDQTPAMVIARVIYLPIFVLSHLRKSSIPHEIMEVEHCCCAYASRRFCQSLEFRNSTMGLGNPTKQTTHYDRGVILDVLLEVCPALNFCIRYLNQELGS